jgi:hypothetical protein
VSADHQFHVDEIARKSTVQAKKQTNLLYASVQLQMVVRGMQKAALSTIRLFREGALAASQELQDTISFLIIHCDLAYLGHSI